MFKRIFLSIILTCSLFTSSVSAHSSHSFFSHTESEYSPSSDTESNDYNSYSLNDNLAKAKSENLYTDTNASYYKIYINLLSQDGIVGGYPDGSFKPKQKINRAEFMKIVVEHAGSWQGFNDQSTWATGNTNPYFSDVDNTAWYATYVNFAKQQGWISGYPDGTFRPDQNINFVEAAKILDKAYNTSFSSESNANPWYRNYVENLAENNSIPIEITSFDQLLTRGQMTEMIARVKTERSAGKSGLDFILGNMADYVVTYETIQSGQDIYNKFNNENSGWQPGGGDNFNEQSEDPQNPEEVVRPDLSNTTHYCEIYQSHNPAEKVVRLVVNKTDQGNRYESLISSKEMNSFPECFESSDLSKSDDLCYLIVNDQGRLENYFLTYNEISQITNNFDLAYGTKVVEKSQCSFNNFQNGYPLEAQQNVSIDDVIFSEEVVNPQVYDFSEYQIIEGMDITLENGVTLKNIRFFEREIGQAGSGVWFPAIYFQIEIGSQNLNEIARIPDFYLYFEDLFRISDYNNLFSFDSFQDQCVHSPGFFTLCLDFDYQNSTDEDKNQFVRDFQNGSMNVRLKPSQYQINSLNQFMQAWNLESGDDSTNLSLGESTLRLIDTYSLVDDFVEYETRNFKIIAPSFISDYAEDVSNVVEEIYQFVVNNLGTTPFNGREKVTIYLGVKDIEHGALAIGSDGIYIKLSQETLNDNYQGLSYNQASTLVHELTHNFIAGSVISVTNEGIATYMGSRIIPDPVVCGENGLISLYTGEVENYANAYRLNDRDFYTSPDRYPAYMATSCFWQDLVGQIGEENFKSGMQLYNEYYNSERLAGNSNSQHSIIEFFEDQFNLDLNDERLKYNVVSSIGSDDEFKRFPALENEDDFIYLSREVIN